MGRTERWHSQEKEGRSRLQQTRSLHKGRISTGALFSAISKRPNVELEAARCQCGGRVSNGERSVAQSGAKQSIVARTKQWSSLLQKGGRELEDVVVQF